MGVRPAPSTAVAVMNTLRTIPCTYLMHQVRLFSALSKGRLSLSVSFSSVLGYLFTTFSTAFMPVFWLFLGGFLVSAGACTLNQWIEQESDGHMQRTKRRPLPMGTLSKDQALYWGVTSSALGLLLLYFGTNPLVAGLSLASSLLYVWGYTPLKRRGQIAVLLGAISGAMPPLLGAVAAQAQVTQAGLLLFGIQFIWQFPHFWAIAWLADQDYSHAGFQLLPNTQKGSRTAVHIMLYTLFLLPMGLLPSYFGYCGITAAWVALAAGGWLLFCAIYLLCKQTRKAARKVMWGSLLYLPVVQLSFVLDKIKL